MKATLRALAMSGLFFCLFSSFIANKSPIYFRAICLEHGALSDPDFIFLAAPRVSKSKAAEDWKRHSNHFNCKLGGIINNIEHKDVFYHKIANTKSLPFTVCLYY